MTANATTLLNGLLGHISIARSTEIISPLFMYADECQEMIGATAGNNAGMTARSARSATTRTRSRRTARATTTARPLSSTQTALLNYLKAHPTATFRQPQLAEVSPFKNWRGNVLSRCITSLVSRNLIQGSASNGWKASPVVPGEIVEQKRQQRAKRSTGRRGSRSATGQAMAATG